MSWKWADSNVKKMNWIDIQFIKASVFFLAFFVASFISEKIAEWRWLWVILFVLFSLIPTYKLLKKGDKEQLKKKSKKGALEMSISTIVIIVIAITMLILGIVFVRSIMCGALGLTGDLNDKVKDEINDLFGSTGGEVQCIGASGEPIKVEPGKLNVIYCAIRAPQAAKYSIMVTDYSAAYSIKSEIKSWMLDDSWEGTVAPNDDIPKKIIRLNIPKEAPDDSVQIQVIIKKEGTIISTQDLDFQISRAGFFRAAMC